MKKNVVLFLFFALAFPILMWGEDVRVVNASRELIIINGTNVPRGSKPVLNLDVKNGIASFELVYYEGLVETSPIRAYREVKGGSIQIRDYQPGLNLAQAYNNASSEEKPSPAPPRRSSVSGGEWWSNVTVVPYNKLEDFSIFVPTGAFKGLALAPNQLSERSATIRTGPEMFPIQLGAAADNKTKIGGEFTWALFNKIITEGQDTLEITVDDIMEVNEGKIINKKVVSYLPFKFMISAGKERPVFKAANVVKRRDGSREIRPTSTKRVELFVGWNIIPIQYGDENGLPTETLMIILVPDDNEPLKIEEGENGVKIMDLR